MNCDVQHGALPLGILWCTTPSSSLLHNIFRFEISSKNSQKFLSWLDDLTMQSHISANRERSLCAICQAHEPFPGWRTHIVKRKSLLVLYAFNHSVSIILALLTEAQQQLEMRAPSSSPSSRDSGYSSAAGNYQYQQAADATYGGSQQYSGYENQGAYRQAAAAPSYVSSNSRQYPARSQGFYDSSASSQFF